MLGKSIPNIKVTTPIGSATAPNNLNFNFTAQGVILNYTLILFVWQPKSWIKYKYL